MRRTLRTAALLLALGAPAAPAAAQPEGGSAACTVPFQVASTQPLGEHDARARPVQAHRARHVRAELRRGGRRAALRAPRAGRRPARGLEARRGDPHDLARERRARRSGSSRTTSAAARHGGRRLVLGRHGGLRPHLAADHLHGPDRAGRRVDGPVHAAHEAAGDRARVLASSVRWDDVAGVEEAKDELREVVEFMRDPKRFKKLGAKVPKGILLHGPPGHRQDAAGEGRRERVEREVLRAVGVLVRRDVRRPRRRAHPAPVPPGAQGGARRSCSSTSSTRSAPRAATTSPARRTRRSTSCSWSSTASASADNVVVIAASNLLEKLDPALLRPGRFDRQILVTPPDLKGRRNILSVHTRDKPLADDVDMEVVARQTSGMTGADLANICNEAAIFAGREHRDDAHDEGLPVGARAGRGRHAVAPRDHRPREAGRGLPRGRPRALLGAARVGGEGPPHLDHPARQGARVHAEPPRGGPLPEDEGGAARLHGRAARRARDRAPDLRRDHDRARRTTSARCTRSAARWSPSTGWAQS